MTEWKAVELLGSVAVANPKVIPVPVRSDLVEVIQVIAAKQDVTVQRVVQTALILLIEDWMRENNITLEKVDQ